MATQNVTLQVDQAIAEVVRALMDAGGYQKLLEELDHAEAIAGIQRGLEAMEAGRTRPVKEFLAELREEFGFPEWRLDKH
ncbi:MAG: type II toxin-antitoxin system Phd/YefM family antitoxin [Blastocatellia bacterium]